MALTIPRFSSDAHLQAASENNPPMQQGATGEGVAILQQALIDLGFDMPISTGQRSRLPDGIFGNETTLTVKKFQRLNALQIDGVVGSQTLSALEKLTIAASDAEESRFAGEFLQNGYVS